MTPGGARLSDALRRGVAGLYLSFVALFLVVPVLVVVVVSFDVVTYVKFPPEGFTLRWYGSVLASDLARLAIRNSIVVAVSCSVLALCLGVPASLVLARRRFAGRDLVYSLVLSSLTFPWIVIGLSLLLLWVALDRELSLATLVVGHTVVAVPYVVRTCTAVLACTDVSYELAARNLGASGVQAFFHVTLPMIRMGILAGATFAFVISFINVPVSLFVTTPDNITLPIMIFSSMLSNFDPGVAAVSSIQLVVILTGLYLAERVGHAGQFLL